MEIEHNFIYHFYLVGDENYLLDKMATLYKDACKKSKKLSKKVKPDNSSTNVRQVIKYIRFQ